MSALLLHGDNATHTIPDSFLVVALDETGHELMSRDSHPVFGIGGCAFRAADYGRLIQTPWRALKAAHFGSAETPMHAADLREPSLAQIEALNEFFLTLGFARIATTIAVEAYLEPGVPPYKIVARQVLDQIARVAQRLGCDGVVLVLEESQRTDRLAAAYFDGYQLERKSGGETTTLEMKKFCMPKSAREPFLEVADFIIHTAGGQVRTYRERQKNWGTRRDFQAVFRVEDQTLVEFLEILNARWTPDADGSGPPLAAQK
jgi:hypothetical protein